MTKKRTPLLELSSPQKRSRTFVRVVSTHIPPHDATTATTITTMAIVYALVSRGKTVLAEYTATSGKNERKEGTKEGKLLKAKNSEGYENRDPMNYAVR